jgi:uracil-DNA glycosylase family 4
MAGSGPRNAEIVVVGEGPGFVEDRDGVPFVGRAGILLNELLAQAGFDRSKMFVTNSVRCRPPENRDPSAAELKACRPYLRDELAGIQPRVVLALGNHALKTLTGESGISAHRGELLPLSPSYGFLSTKAFATVHPAAGLRYPHMRQQTEEDLAMLRRLLDDDFQTIAVPWEPGDRTKLDDTQELWAFDCETNSRETRDPFCHVYCCAIDCGTGPVQVFTNMKQTAHDLALQTTIMQGRVVGHNASRFDRLMLRRIAGRDLKCDDTMLMGFLLHEDWGPAKRLNLESLCAAELGVRPWKKDVTWNWREAESIPKEAMHAYCARDTRYTRELALKLAPKLQSEGLWNLYDKLLLPASRALADMEERGVYVNAANVAEARTYWEAEAEMQLEALHAIKPDFNPRSSKQVGELLFDEMGYEPVDRTKGGKASTAVGTLKTLREQYHDDPVFDALLKYRRSQKMLGTYIAKFESEPDKWGMLYPWYSMTNTVTGRTSGDLQQIPRVDTGPMIRRCIGVPPGKVLLSADFSQLEMRVAASRYVFDEPNLRAAFERGDDVHLLLAAEINGVPPEQVTKKMRQDAKPINFLCLYGGEAEMIVRTLLEDYDLVKPYEEAQRDRDAYFRRWKGLPAGHGRVIAALDREGFVRTFFGFKRRLPDCRADDRKIVVAAYREAVNVVVQNPACYMALIGLVLLGAAGLDVRSFQHDAYLCWVDDKEAAVRAAAAQIRGLLEQGVPRVLASEFGIEWDVPLKVDITAGTAWTQDDRQQWIA